jgi:hypothetical protein
MASKITQERNTVTNGDVVAGNKSEVHNYTKKTKLSTLFERLKEEFEGKKQCKEISDDLKKYSEPRDTIGLEQKLIDGERGYLIEDAKWLKQEYYKKLTKYQFFEPAQEIHSYLLGIVLEKFRNLIYPLIRNGATDVEISATLSNEIINPIVQIIQEEGCNDIMGLGSTDIEGMIYFLTGLCHLKWNKNDSLSPSV